MFYQKTVLPNGITVVTEHMDSVRSIALGLWFGVGSRDETPEEAGMSHLMEHMMFKGTKKYSAIEISSAFDAMGAELNAFTSKENTCYYSRFVDDKLVDVIGYLSDMVLNSTFAPENIEPERKVVLEEIARSHDTPDDYIFDVFSDALWPTDTLGRPVLGEEAVVANATQESCQAYHDKHYRTENMVVSAAGNIDHDVLVALVSSLFANMGTGSRNIHTFRENAQSKRSAIVAKPTEQAHLVIGFSGLPANDGRRYVGGVLDNIMGGSMSSRLFQEVREKRGLVYSVFGFQQQYTGAGEFVAYAGTRPDNIGEVYQVINEQLDKAEAEGVSETEVERVRTYAAGQLTLSSESTTSRMTRLGRSEINNRPQSSLEDSIAGYAAVTLEQVNALAHDLYTAKRTVALISPIEEAEVMKIIG